MPAWQGKASSTHQEKQPSREKPLLPSTPSPFLNSWSRQALPRGPHTFGPRLKLPLRHSFSPSAPCPVDPHLVSVSSSLLLVCEALFVCAHLVPAWRSLQVCLHAPFPGHTVPAGRARLGFCPSSLALVPPSLCRSGETGAGRSDP